MGTYNQQEFNKYIIENEIIGFFPEGRTLKSGRFSYWYANCRNLASTVGKIDKTAQFMASYIESECPKCDYIYGVPAGVTGLATIVNYKMGMAKNPDHRVVIGREKPKEHGDPKDRYFIGPVKKGDRVIVIEDVTTTGGSMLQSLDSLAEAGAEIVGVVAIFDRMEIRDDGKTVAQCVEEKGSKYFSMTDADQLIQPAIDKYNPGREFLEKFQEKYNEFAVKKINITG